MFSPARCTTASHPESAAASRRPRAGSHGMSSGAACPPGRTRHRTRCPTPRSAGTSVEPTSPEAPLTTMITQRCYIVPERMTGGLAEVAAVADEAGADGEADELGAAMQAELAHAVGPVTLGGAGADAELPAGLGAAQPFGRHAQHLALAGRQAGERFTHFLR